MLVEKSYICYVCVADLVFFSMSKLQILITANDKIFTFLDQAHVFQGKQAPNTKTAVRCIQVYLFLDLTLGLISVVLCMILIIISTFVRHLLHW